MPSVGLGFRRTGRPVFGRVRLEQLDEVARWILEQDLLPANTLSNFVPKAAASRREPGDVGVQVLNNEVDTVPAARCLLLARGHAGATSGAGLGLSQVEVHVPERDFCERRSGMHLQSEAKMMGVEVNRGVDIVNDIANTRGQLTSPF